MTEVLDTVLINEGESNNPAPAKPNVPPTPPDNTIQLPVFGDSGSVVATQGENGTRNYVAMITGEVSFPSKYIQLLDTLYHARKGDTITIKIASPGGMVETGIAILTAIENTQAKVTTVALGLVASIASIIWMAGHERIMMPESTLMVHGPSGLQAGKVSDIKEECDMIDAYFRDLLIRVSKGVLTSEQLNHVLEHREDYFISADTIMKQMKGG